MTVPPELLEHLDDLAARTMDTWHVPGLAYALAWPGEPPVLRTHGVRDIATGQAVTPATQFHACSLTKSLTAAGLLLLMDEQQVPVSRRVRELLPDFRLADPLATGQVTVRDFLCHASGLPRHDRIWSAGLPSREEMLACLPLLATNCGLRERFQYNNLGYVVLAAITERLAGVPWEQYIASTLLGPLGCAAPGFTPAALLAAPDHAHPHPHEGERIFRGKAWAAPAPAGGLNASIADLARWLQALLGGEIPGIPTERWERVRARMATPWMYAAPPESPELWHVHYGAGLAIGRYRNALHLHHTGSLPGWGAAISLLPEHGAGLAVLTNRDPSPVGSILPFAAYDALLGGAPVDWFARFVERRAKALVEEEAQRAKVASQRGEPARELHAYVGRYADPAYGDIEVTLDHAELRWSWRELAGTLQACGGDAFRLRETGPARFAEPIRGSFLADGAGRVDRLALPLEPEVADIAFRRG